MPARVCVPANTASHMYFCMDVRVPRNIPPGIDSLELNQAIRICQLNPAQKRFLVCGLYRRRLTRAMVRPSFSWRWPTESIWLAARISGIDAARVTVPDVHRDTLHWLAGSHVYYANAETQRHSRLRFANVLTHQFRRNIKRPCFQLWSQRTSILRGKRKCAQRTAQYK